MTVVDPGLLAAVATGAGIGGGLLLLIAGLRGVHVDATRPPPRWRRVLIGARSRGTGTRLVAAAGVGVLVLVLTRWPVAAAAGAGLVLAWRYLFGGLRAEHLVMQRLEALVIWTESLRDTLAANASLEQAIPVSIAHAPPVLQVPLQRLAGQVRVQVPLDAALLDLAADLDDASADLVVAALVLNVSRRGDRLAQVLGALAASGREELELRQRITAGRAELRRGVQLVAAVTVVFAAYLSVFGGQFLDPYDTPAGQVVLAVVVGMFAAGFWWMRALAQAADSQPFLARPGHRLTPTDLQVVASVTGLSAADARDLARPPVSTPARHPGSRGGAR